MILFKVIIQVFQISFSSTSRLLNVHFPHLCLVEDWLDAHSGLLASTTSSDKNMKKTSVNISAEQVAQGNFQC